MKENSIKFDRFISPAFLKSIYISNCTDRFRNSLLAISKMNSTEDSLEREKERPHPPKKTTLKLYYLSK